MAFTATPDVIADTYAASRARVIALVADLDATQLALPVPGTPKWTVHGVLSHLVGGPVDAVEGQMDGAPGDEWTARQVAARRESTIASMLAEWERVAPQIDAGVRAGTVPAAIALDVLTHEADVRVALDAPPTPDPKAVRFLLEGFAGRAVAVATKRGLPPLSLRATDSGWSAGPEGAAVIGATTEWEWTRALPGRRSVHQVTGYDWSGDPAPYLAIMCPFGPLADSDVIE